MSSPAAGFIPKCLSCLRDAGSIGFYFLECGHFICEACIQHQQHSSTPTSALPQSNVQCPVCHTQCKAISLMDASHIPKNIYEFVSSKYRNILQEPLAKMEEIIKFQHSHYEHVIRQLKSENQSLKETIQMLNNQKKNPTYQQLPNQYHQHGNGQGLVNSMMNLPEFNNHQLQYNGDPQIGVFDDRQNKGLNNYHSNIVMGEAPMTPYVNNRGNPMMNSRTQQQRMSNGGGSGEYQAQPSMSPLSSKSSARMQHSTNYQKEDLHSGRRSVTPLSNMAEKLRSASPKLPSVSPIRASPNQNLNESLSIIMNQPPSSPSGLSDMTTTRHSNGNARLSMNDNIENVDPKTPMRGKSLLPSKTPQPSSNSNRSFLQSRATPQLGSKQGSNNPLAKSILPSSSRSSSEVQPSNNNNTETFVENQASDLGLPNRSQLKPLLKKKAPETPPLSALGIQKQNKTLPSNTMDPTRTPLLSRKLINLSTPSRQRPQSNRGVPPKI